MPKSVPPTMTMVTICRNNAHDIEATLLSVLNQKTDEIEYIVIDGASTDDTMKIVRKYESQIDRIVSEPDKGVFDAINKGIRAGTGALVGLIHAGDRLLPGVLKEVLAAHRSNPGSILYGGIKTTRNGVFQNIVGANHETLPQYMIPHPGAFVPRSVYDQHGLYDPTLKITSDYKAFLKYYYNGVPFQWLDLLVAEFDLSGASQNLKAMKVEIVAFKKEMGLWTQKSLWKRIKSLIWRLLNAIPEPL